jgi:transposase
MGPEMAIDEKQIGEEMHTILSNRQTGKIAVLAKSISARELKEIIPKFDLKGFDVKTITSDLSPSYDWFCRQAFCNSMHVADKFHIIKSLLDACQDVRTRYRQELLTDKRLKFKEFKEEEHKRKQNSKQNNQPFVAQKFVYKEQRASNGETIFELLARSRYLLYKYPHDWTVSQKERAIALFKHYPEIEKAYNISCNFRTWYRKVNIGKDKNLLIEKLKQLYLQVEDAAVMEMENFKSTVEQNETMILNYFVKGDTNAIAECINSKIQRFITSNQGTIDKEFFYFRLAKNFSSTSK